MEIRQLRAFIAIAESGTFTADKNGNIVGSLTLAPVSAASVGFRILPRFGELCGQMIGRR